jgi:hypothetical protein
MLGSPSSLSSHAQGQELPRLADFERFASNRNFAFNFLEPQNPLDPTQYAVCHRTKYFHHPQHEETHGTSSNCLGITNILSNRPGFLETPGPTTCSEGPSNGSCSFVYSTPWNMLSASSSFSGRQAEDTVDYDCFSSIFTCNDMYTMVNPRGLQFGKKSVSSLVAYTQA